MAHSSQFHTDSKPEKNKIFRYQVTGIFGICLSVSCDGVPSFSSSHKVIKLCLQGSSHLICLWAACPLFLVRLFGGLIGRVGHLLLVIFILLLLPLDGLIVLAFVAPEEITKDDLGRVVQTFILGLGDSSAVPAAAKTHLHYAFTQIASMSMKDSPKTEAKMLHVAHCSLLFLYIQTSFWM